MTDWATIKNIGAVTCKNSTVVDYCIMSPELFTHVTNFEISSLGPLLSDFHNGFMSNSSVRIMVHLRHMKIMNQ